MNYVYSINISKKSKVIPEIKNLLKSLFTITWELSSSKNNETWLCARKEPVDIKDLMWSIKSINKRIIGVMIMNVDINQMSCDKGGDFYIADSKSGHPSTEEAMSMFMNLNK